MTRHIHIMNPADIKAGTKLPDGREVAKCTLYENPEAGVLIAAIDLVDGTQDVRTWALAYGWTINGEVYPDREEEGDGT